MKNEKCFSLALLIVLTPLLFFGCADSTTIGMGDSNGVVDSLACSVDADCVVKNVGNCCGYFPSCANTDFEPDLDAVALECEESGLTSVCGFPEVSGCECADGSCRNIDL